MEPSLDAVRRGEAAAVAALIERDHRALRGFVAAICLRPDLVDDIAQEVFVRALARIASIRSVEEFPRLLRGIARNVVREQHRARGRRWEALFAAAEVACPPPDAPAYGEDTIARLRRCLERLTARARRLLDLRYGDEADAQTIGRELGLSSGAVRIALLRVREGLARCLAERR